MVNFRDLKNSYLLNKNLFGKKNVTLSADKVEIRLYLCNFLLAIIITKKMMVILFEN